LLSRVPKPGKMEEEEEELRRRIIMFISRSIHE